MARPLVAGATRPVLAHAAGPPGARSRVAGSERSLDLRLPRRAKGLPGWSLSESRFASDGPVCAKFGLGCCSGAGNGAIVCNHAIYPVAGFGALDCSERFAW